MPRGGTRPGAGRPRGSEGKRTIAIREIADSAIADGQLPLEYMLEVMRTSKDAKRRDAMAVAAAPYVHPRLSATKVSTEDDEDPFKVIMRSLDGINRGLPPSE